MFYVGTFVSMINFDDPTIAPHAFNAHKEVDIYGGIKPKWGAVTFDLGAIGYLYANNVYPYDVSYLELKAGASTTVLKDVNVGATFYYSPNTQGELGATYVLEGTASKSVFKHGDFDFALSATLGGFWYADHTVIQPLVGTTINHDYVYGNAGLTVTYKDNYSIDFRYWDTNLDKGAAPCGAADHVFQCGGAFSATAKVSF
jgi:hypothetical protein